MWRLKELIEALGEAPAAQALVESGASPREAVHAVEQVATSRAPMQMPAYQPPPIAPERGIFPAVRAGARGRVMGSLE